MVEIQDKVIIITGASSGLGRQLAIELTKKKAKLLLFARNEKGLKETQKYCKSYCLSVPEIFVGDVTVLEDCKQALDLCLEKYGCLDVLINNAGQGMWSKFEDISTVKSIMDVNYMGAVNFTHVALPALKQSQGKIVAISSIQGKQAVPYHSLYAASKHAVQGFFNALRIEQKESKVSVLLALPSWIRNPSWRQNTLGADGQAMQAQHKKHNKSAVDPNVCAKKIISAMEQNKNEVVIPKKLRWLPLLNMIFPKTVEKIICKKVSRQNK